VDLAVLVRQLLDSLNAQITRAKVQASLHIEPGFPVILGNKHALEQVFNNLISNALHAMEAKGGRLVIKIHFNLSTEVRKYVQVSVADTGRGIPAELHERIFQPFFTTERSGTGLGLPITKRIVTAHKGNIRLESFPGGTVFHVQFPAHNQKVEVTL
jgi:signal transduction histidine kinase